MRLLLTTATLVYVSCIQGQIDWSELGFSYHKWLPGESDSFKVAWPSGNVKSINVLEGGVMTRKEYYENGSLMFQAEVAPRFHHDTLYTISPRTYLDTMIVSLYWAEAPIGNIIAFHKNGIVKASGNSTDWGGPEGIWRVRDSTGVPTVEYTYSRGYLNGITTRFLPSGTIQDRLSYLNGELRGPFESYFPNGQPKEAGSWSYVDDLDTLYFGGYPSPDTIVFISKHERVLDDSYGTYFENGQTKVKGYYDKGFKVGYWEQWDSLGTLRSTEWYHGGLLDGTQNLFFENGDLHKTCNYWLGARTRDFSEYYENGGLKERGSWLIVFDTNAVLTISNITYLDTVIPVTSMNSVFNGDYELFYPSGQVDTRGAYDAGIKAGTWKYYDDTGKLIRKEKHPKRPKG